jgi:hypothetical protein
LVELVMSSRKSSVHCSSTNKTLTHLNSVGLNTTVCVVVRDRWSCSYNEHRMCGASRPDELSTALMQCDLRGDAVAHLAEPITNGVHGLRSETADARELK